jgi:hypothetical protein
MGLMELIRKAEEQSRRAARRGMERARASWDETERRLRRKMRLNRPPAETPTAGAEVHDISQGTRELRQHGQLGVVPDPESAELKKQRRRA